MPSPLIRRFPGVGIATLSVLTALALSGCAATAAPLPAASGPHPVIDNCGTPVTVPTSPPQRIVTIKSTTTETLLALGLGDRIVGSAFSDGPVPARWLTGAAAVPVISEFAPSTEAVLKLDPDFVYAGWESMLTADAAGDRATLASLGIGTYVAPSACKEPGYQPKKLSFEAVFAEIEQAGTVFGAEPAAQKLVAAQRVTLAGIPTDTRKLSALWYSSGTDIPYVGAGIGAPEMMMERLGLVNVARSVKDTWTSLGWEAIVANNPAVIVLVDASWNTAANKITLLESNPATAVLDAVKNKRYLVVPFAAGEAGVRSVDAVADLASQLAAIGRG